MLHTRESLINKKTIIIGIAALIVIGVVIAGLVVFLGKKHTEQGSKPTFTTILPGEASIDQLGGWTRISPPENDPVYAYTDMIDGISINVSQQPLPDSFKGDIDNKVAELAKKFNATNTLKTDDTKIYLGISAKGPQSVIFAKNNLLILIKSQERIADTAWLNYIGSLN